MAGATYWWDKKDQAWICKTEAARSTLESTVLKASDRETIVVLSPLAVYKWNGSDSTKAE